jgi:hypothetical protein
MSQPLEENTQDLGDFTPQARIVEMPHLTFRFCGVKYRVGKRFNTIAWLRFAEAMNTATQRKTSSIREMGEFGSLIRKVVVEEQAEDFLDAIEEADMSEEDLMQLMNKILEAVSGRPTKPQPDSSTGLRTITPNSTDNSSGVPAAVTVDGSPVAY